MMIRLIRDDLGAPFEKPGAPQTQTLHGRVWWLNGAVIDVDCKGGRLLVFHGDAEPADDEAEQVCAGWRDNREKTLLSRDMLAKAIDPDDREAYKQGVILGYDANGDYIPGPNWADHQDEEEETEDEWDEQL